MMGLVLSFLKSKCKSDNPEEVIVTIGGHVMRITVLLSGNHVKLNFDCDRVFDIQRKGRVKT